MEKTLFTANSEETKKLGALLAPLFKAGDVVLLKGDLGAGKTTFVKGVAKALKEENEVVSPTFNIMRCYFKGTLPLYHIDAYRLEHQNIELGLDEFIEGNGVTFIEWPDYIKPLIPAEHLEIYISNEGEDSRKLVLVSNNPHYDEIVRKAEVTL